MEALQFKKDLDIEEELLQTDPMPAALKHILDTSCLKLVSVQQYKHAFEEFDWISNREVVELSLERSGGIITTHPVEDCNNVQNNAGQSKASSKFRRPQRAMAVSLQKKVLHVRHQYKKLDTDHVVVPRSTVLGVAAFGKSNSRKPSVSLSGIASTAAKAPFFAEC